MKKKITSLIVILIVVLAFVVVAGVYYFLNQGQMDRAGDVAAGDRACGDFADAAAQDACCANVHSNEIHVLCEGKWNYLSGVRKCQYVCTGVLPTCSEDFRVCESGTVVGRNPGAECEFYNCP